MPLTERGCSPWVGVSCEGCSGLPGGVDLRSATGNPGLPLKGGRGDSEKEEMCSWRGVKEDWWMDCGEECFSGPGYARSDETNGEGKLEPAGAGGGYWLGREAEITSEMEGSDCLEGPSPSSGARRGSEEEIILPGGLRPAGWEFWEKAVGWVE